MTDTPREDISDLDAADFSFREDGGVRYVTPTWDRADTDDPDDEQLRKCGSCNRFFVESVPLILFVSGSGLGRGLGQCLNVEICSGCAGAVVKHHMAPQPMPT